MQAGLRIFILLFVITYFVFISNLIRKNKMKLKYGLLWLFFGIIMIILAIWPEILAFFANLFQIEVASNALFAICIFVEMIIMISLTTVISEFSEKIKRSVQYIALLEERIRELERKMEE